VQLREVLGPADERDEIESRVERASENAFPPDRPSQREQRGGAAKPW
jgi:hypothetical protein